MSLLTLGAACAFRALQPRERPHREPCRTMQSELQTSLVLYADDNADDRVLVSAAMSRLFPDVALRCVADGQAVLSYLWGCAESTSDADWPATLLLDAAMPGTSGLDVLREVKSHPALSRLPVVVLSTSARAEDVQQAYDLGACAFVRKPRSLQSLHETLVSLSQFWLRPENGQPGYALRTAS